MLTFLLNFYIPQKTYFMEEGVGRQSVWGVGTLGNVVSISLLSVAEKAQKQEEDEEDSDEDTSSESEAESSEDASDDSSDECEDGS